jgi:hypothetical protein
LLSPASTQEVPGRHVKEESPSFLKKRSERLSRFRRLHLSGHGLHLSARTKIKSLLLLFFRKEGLPCLTS